MIQNIQFPKKMCEALCSNISNDGKILLPKHKYTINYGGRGGAKSYSVALYNIMMTLQQPLRVFYLRDYGTSINDSFHHLIRRLIYEYKLEKYFDIKEKYIKVLHNKSEFRFRGIKNDPEQIRSVDDIDICVIEEANTIDAYTWKVLIPSIRNKNRNVESKIIINFNPEFETDSTYKTFILQDDNKYYKNFINYLDNPFCPQSLIDEAEKVKRYDYEAYRNIWLGETITYSDALVYKDKFVVDTFEPFDKKKDTLYIGCDWGFSNDETALISCFIRDDVLYINHELYKTRVELNQLESFFLQMPFIKETNIVADNQQPSIIQFMKDKGFYIKSCEKWKGSIQDGVIFIRGFKKVVIHPNCKNTLNEFSNYKHKIDKRTGNILADIDDKYNHLLDALRYSLENYILKKMNLYTDLFKYKK